MSQQITIKNLRAVADLINRETNSPRSYWQSLIDTANRKTNIGHYYIDCAYGRYALTRVSNEMGGESDVLSSGHTTKRELYNLMHAYRAGLRDAVK